MNKYVDLNQSLGLIQVSGENTEKFLQGQLTCDVTEVTAQQSRLGAHCDPKGRIQATFRLFKYHSDYYFLLPQNMVLHLINCLQKYAVFFKVKLTDVSEQWQKYGLMGERAIDVAKSISPEKIVLNVSDKQQRFIILSMNRLELSDQFELADINVWQLLDIIAGVPTIYPETKDEFTPHQINYHLINGVSFTKGCYTGQEIIARMHYLGKSKQSMYHVTFVDRQFPTPGTKLFIDNDGQAKEVGIVLMTASDDANHYQALVCLHNQVISNTIHVRDLSGPIVTLLGDV